MFSGFCADRLVLCRALALALVGAQDAPATRQIDLTVTEGTSMAAAASPDRRSMAIDLLGGIWILPCRDVKRVMRGGRVYSVADLVKR